MQLKFILAVVGNSVIGSLFLVTSSGCTYHSEGAYVYGHNSNPSLAGIHSTAVNALGPDIDQQYCFGRGGEEQISGLERKSKITVKNGHTVENSSQTDYVIQNNCGAPR